MERQDINSGSFDWYSVLRHVAGKQTSIEIFENDVPLARVEPAKRPVPMAELDSVLSDVPSLGDDAKQFERDVENVLKELPGEVTDPWES